jgi:hypothetical protein
MKINKKTTISSALTLLTLFVVSTSAHAESITPPENGGVTNSSTVSSNCELALKQAVANGYRASQDGLCKVALKTTVSSSKPVLSSELGGLKSTMSLGDYKALSFAVSLGTVRSRTYYQQVVNLSNTESQSGTLYYDGTRVWVSETYRGFTGSHRCQIERASIFSVTPQNCYESGSSSRKTLSQQWLFTVTVNAGAVSLPFSWSETYSLNVDAYGQTW